jgi:hypothetical protein
MQDSALSRKWCAMIRVALVYLFWMGIIGGSTTAVADEAEMWDPGPAFGPEFTFYRPGAEAPDLISHVQKHLVESQPAGAEFQRSENTFSSPNGWNFTVKQDGLDILEVTVTPMVVADYERFSSDLQDAIFVSAQKLNMWPALFRGGGHINMDLEYFRERPILLRNFLVDQVNHSEISLGIMNYDTNNAVPIATPVLLEQFKNAIQVFDYDITQTPIGTYALDSLLKALYTNFYYASSDFPIWGHQWIGKHSSISFSRAIFARKPQTRIELRSVRPQTSINAWIRQIKLFRDRIRFLDRTFGNQLIPIEIRVPILPMNQSARKLVPPVNPQDALREFYIFVRESGHPWSDHRDYLWPVWTIRQEGQSSSELERFESSPWFEAQEQILFRDCNTLLSAASVAQ